MPVSFILTGLILLYLLFYGEKIAHKRFFAIMLFFIMVGFFVGDIEIVDNTLLNIFIMIPTLSIAVYLVYRIGKIDKIVFGISSLISLGIYALLLFFDLEYSTLLSPEFIFIITLIVGIVFSYRISLSISYLIWSYIFYDVLNVFFVKSSMRVVSILSVSTFELIMYSVAICFVSNIIIHFVSSRFTKEKKINV